MDKQNTPTATNQVIGCKRKSTDNCDGGLNAGTVVMDTEDASSLTNSPVLDETPTRPLKAAKVTPNSVASSTNKPTLRVNLRAPELKDNLPYHDTFRQIAAQHKMTALLRQKEPPNAPSDIVSLVHPACESVLLTLCIPHGYPQHVTTIRFRAEINTMSPFRDCVSPTLCGKMQKALSVECAARTTAPLLLELAGLWKNVLRGSLTPVELEAGSALALVQERLESECERWCTRVLSPNTLEVWITAQDGTPVRPPPCGWQTFNVDRGTASLGRPPQGRASGPSVAGRVVWTTVGTRTGSLEEEETEFPPELQERLTHVMVHVTQAARAHARSGAKAQPPSQTGTEASFSPVEGRVPPPVDGRAPPVKGRVLVRYAWKFEGSSALLQYTLDTSLMLQRNKMGVRRRVRCLLVGPPSESPRDFLRPTEEVCQYPALDTVVESVGFQEGRPKWLRTEELKSTGPTVLVPPEDERFALLTAGLPLGWKVHEAHLVLQPKQRRLFQAALEVEEIDTRAPCAAPSDDKGPGAMLCWHGAPREAALGIVTDGPSSVLSGVNSQRRSYGSGFYLARNAEVSLHPKYAVPDAKTGFRCLLKCVAVASRPCPNVGGGTQVIPHDKNCFTDRVVQPRVIVHQKPSYVLVLGMVVVQPQ